MLEAAREVPAQQAPNLRGIEGGKVGEKAAAHEGPRGSKASASVTVDVPSTAVPGLVLGSASSASDAPAALPDLGSSEIQGLLHNMKGLCHTVARIRQMLQAVAAMDEASGGELPSM